MKKAAAVKSKKAATKTPAKKGATPKAKAAPKKPVAKKAAAKKVGKPAKRVKGMSAPAAEEVAVVVKGAFEINEHNVVLNPEVVKLVELKKWTATAKIAAIDGAFYVGWNFASEKQNAVSQCIVREGDDWPSGAEALDHAAESAEAFFKHCERSGERVPPAVYTLLKEFRAQEAGTDVVHLDPVKQLAEDVREVVRHYGRISGTVSVDAVKIARDLGMPADRATGVVNELRGRRMLVMGCLDKENESVKAILGPEGEEREGGEPQERPAQRTQPAAEGRLMTVPIDQVVVCPLNPRKRVDPGSIEEMADSILEHDIVQPPIARPGKYADTYEVVFGQRRLLGKRRAIEKAKEEGRPPVREVIQLIVREMDDRTALEEAWVENLQKVDVGAREEVEGFQAMLALRDDAGNAVYSVTSLAARLGKQKQFISRRLRLCAVPDSMWSAYEDGAIGLAQMELVGRLPTEAARKKAADLVLRPKFRPAGEPLTKRETIAMLREEFMVSLRGCGWDLEDAELIPVKRDKGGERVSGGACSDCPFRTGSNEDLQDSLSGTKGGGQGLDANSCMQPSCFDAKREALWARTMREASEAGSRVLSPEEAKRTFYAWGAGGPQPASGLVSLSAHPGYQETGHHASEDTMPTWGEMIKKVDAKDLVIAKNEATGEIHRMLKRERAIELAEAGMKKWGKDSPFANRPGARREDDDEDDASGDEDEDGGQGTRGPSEWEIKRDRRRKLEAAIDGRLVEMAKLVKNPAEDVFTELILGTLWEEVGYNGGLMERLIAGGLPEFNQEDGDDDAKVRAYLDEVVRPEIARAPLAWAALALYEIYDQVMDVSDPIGGDGLLRALNLDREAILAVEETTEVESVEVEA